MKKRVYKSEFKSEAVRLSYQGENTKHLFETVAKGLNFPLHFFSFIFLLPNTIYFAFFQVFQVYKSLF